jgi:hypothetical protein
MDKPQRADRGVFYPSHGLAVAVSRRQPCDLTRHSPTWGVLVVQRSEPLPCHSNSLAAAVPLALPAAWMQLTWWVAVCSQQGSNWRSLLHMGQPCDFCATSCNVLCCVHTPICTASCFTGCRGANWLVSTVGLQQQPGSSSWQLVGDGDSAVGLQQQPSSRLWQLVRAIQQHSTQEAAEVHVPGCG